MSSGKASAENDMLRLRLRDHGWDLGEQIGKGSNSNVYKCSRTPGSKVEAPHLTHTSYACKVVDIRGLRLQPNYQYKKQRIHEEVSIMKMTSHGNIIQLLDDFEVQNTVFLIMELFEGEELYDLILRKKRLDEDTARTIFRQVVDAVAYLHSNKIIHRDLKPENILVNPETLQIKLIDFGLSKVISQSMAKTFVGTPEYFAPEIQPHQAESSIPAPAGVPLAPTAYDCAADCWSLGIILYVMLMGNFPSFYNKVASPRSPALPSPDVSRALARHATSDSDMSDAPPEFTAVVAKVSLGDCKGVISSSAMNLIASLLVENPGRRLSARGAANSPWLKSNVIHFEMGDLSPFEPRALSQSRDVNIDESDIVDTIYDSEEQPIEARAKIDVTSTSTGTNESGVAFSDESRQNVMSPQDNTTVEDISLEPLDLGQNFLAASEDKAPATIVGGGASSLPVDMAYEPTTATRSLSASRFARSTSSHYALALSQPNSPGDGTSAGKTKNVFVHEQAGAQPLSPPMKVGDMFVFESLHASLPLFKGARTDYVRNVPHMTSRTRALSDDHEAPQATLNSSQRQPRPSASRPMRSITEILSSVSEHFQAISLAYAALRVQASIALPGAHQDFARASFLDIHETHKLLQHVESTTQSVLEAAVSLMVGVESKIPDLITKTLATVQTWITDLQTTTLRLHSSNHSNIMKIGEHIDWVTATILKHSHDSTTLPRGSESERSSDSRVVMLNESHPLQQICNRLTSVHAIFVEVGSMLGHLDVVMAALSRKTQNLNVLVEYLDRPQVTKLFTDQFSAYLRIFEQLGRQARLFCGRSPRA